MCAVIEFPTDRVAVRQPGRQTQPAEVIIFSGVQLERREFIPAGRVIPARLPHTQAAADPS